MAAGVSVVSQGPGPGDPGAWLKCQVRGAPERFALAVLGCTGVGKSALAGRFVRCGMHPPESDRHRKTPWCQG